MTAYILNLFDLFFTLHALSNGAVELNPLMQCVPIMIFCKVFVVGTLCWWLNKREEKAAKAGLTVCALYFAFINLWHIVNLFYIGGIAHDY